ncbi:MAG: electron transfer flavoprotein subunit beta/FixA family protein [Gammaproteobacteria bacterium]|nr:MAG: electron transfer flavoprotein subunit beta/FixA family protein [Gammaproteobacteria bacterium]
MKVLVGIKRVVDHNVRVRARADGSGADIASAKMSINPFDEHAVEEAVRLKEAGVATEVVVVTTGAANAQDILRHALALGADRAILVETAEHLNSLASAKVLHAIVKREVPQLILIGKQAIDDDAAEVGQMLAALLNVGQGTFASKLTIADGKVTVTREIDGGQETLELNLPAVITADLRLNDPRYIKLPNLMLAKKKPLETIALADLDVNTASKVATINVAEPPARAAGKILNSVEELIEILHAQVKG